MTKPVLQLTEDAITHIRDLMAQSDQPVVGLRVSIVSAGCSGHKYQFDYAVEGDIEPTDTLVEQDGVKVYVDQMSLVYLLGSVMDFKTEQFKSGFTFENPNVSSACGCGESVSFTRDDLENQRG